MKRQHILLILCGVVLLAVCGTAGWFLFAAIRNKSQAAETRDSAYSEVQRLYGAKVFPNAETIAQVKADEDALTQWLGTASNLVHRGDLSVTRETPTGFKQILQNTVRSLSDAPGSVNGKAVASGFNFGFDNYLGESVSLPKEEHVARLMEQLRVIERICKELYAARILSLDGVVRETFDLTDAAAAEGRSDDRRRKRREEGSVPDKAVRPNNASAEWVSKQRFSFVFKARPDTLIEVLNRLAAMDLFVVVAETELHKTEDALAKAREAKRTSEDGGSAFGGSSSGAVVDPSTLPHSARIVSDPELEPPLSVRLDIDVLSFEGV